MPVHQASEILHDGFQAWVQDCEASRSEYNRMPGLQVDVIPLACVWGLVMQHCGLDRRTVREFTNDVLADQSVMSTLRTRLHPVERNTFQFPIIPVPDFATTGPYAHDRWALSSGRDKMPQTVTGREYVIIGALAHASYNSTSGVPMLQLDPLGPHPRAPEAWKILAPTYPHTIAFAAELEVIET